MRLFFCLTLTIALTGCGGSAESSGTGMSADSFTAKAFDEFRAGKGIDAKGKVPPASEIAKVKKRIKVVEPRSKKDLLQGLRILSDQRDHEDLHFNTMMSSNYIAEAYKRAFGPLEDVVNKENTSSWSIPCTDGKMKLRGILKQKHQPGEMLMYPPITK